MTAPPPAEVPVAGGEIRRIVYLGTPDLAVPPLLALHEAGYEIPLVVSRADKRRRRGSGDVPSPVKEAALELGLDVTHELDDVRGVEADLGVIVAYGRIIPASLLDRLAMVNLHFSLLPRWRGAAPVERAILSGDERTGVCLMAVEEGLDTGGVFRRDEVEIGVDETLDELRNRLVRIGSGQLLAALADGFGEPVPQDGEPVTAAKILPEEQVIDWDRPAVDIHRQVRVGGAWTTLRGKRFKIHRSALADAVAGPPGTIDGLTVATADGGLLLVEVQGAGKARQDAATWRNGAQLRASDRLV